jgi:uncharacterized protein (DUF2147 family)
MEEWMRRLGVLKAAMGLGLVLAFSLGGGTVRAQATDVSSPVGFWRTIDDRTNKPDGVVQIYERDGMLFGKITGIDDPRFRTALCQHCGGDDQNQPIMGLEVLRDMHADGRRWDGGTILNPQDGQVYHCRMHLGPDGQTLIVRGFIGTPMLGRTQTWQRLPG